MENMPRTWTDLLNEVSDCVENRDTDRLEDLQHHVRNWMQMEHETNSQLRLMKVVSELLLETE